MIYIVGICHHMQYKNINNNLSLTDDFISFVKTKIEELHISFVGEEWNADASKINNVQLSTVEQIARELKLPYKATEATFLEREIRGIQSNEYSKREQFWYEQISKEKYENVLFICGKEHISIYTSQKDKVRFDRLLKKRGWEVTISSNIFICNDRECT